MQSRTLLCVCRVWLRPFVCGLAALTFAVAAGRAGASTLITDGGFEGAVGGQIYGAGTSLDGAWNVTAGTVYIETADPYVYDGQNSLNLTLANLYAPNTVSQSLATVIGQLYSVSFWGNADSANSFSLLENGMGLNGAPTSIANNGFPGAVSNSSLFQNYTATFTANSASTLLSFTDTGNPGINSSNGSVEIDDVSAQAVTPEPESLVFVLTGAVGLGGLLRRRWLGRSAC